MKSGYVSMPAAGGGSPLVARRAPRRDDCSSCHITRGVVTDMRRVGCLLLTAACATTPEVIPARQRDYKLGSYDKAAEPASSGSLWQESSRSLVADFRASRVGDLVMVKIDESPEAKGDADTKLDRESSMSFGVPQMFGFAQALEKSHPGLDMANVFEVMSKTHFAGTGETSRSSRVEAAMAVRVKKALPNGDLFVEGTKVLHVNDEELHIYVSGVVRPEDIAQDNSVNSSVVADAEIEFVGRGVLTDNQSQGWLTKFLGAINPF